MDQVRIYTDGGAQPNPGTGGWAAILISGSHQKEISGYERCVTNNQMELTAAIEALKALRRPCVVTLVTDSKYLIDGHGWIPGWKKNGWRTSKGMPVKNQALWMELDRLTGVHQVTWEWTKGHAMNEFNNRCDELCTEAIRAAAASKPTTYWDHITL